MEESSQSKLNKFLFYLVFAVIVLALAYFAYIRFATEREEVSEFALSSLPSEEQLEILRQSNSFPLPQVASETEVSFSSLPSYVQGLFANMQGDSTAKSLTFADNTLGYTTGYSINFSSTSNTVEELYFLFQRNSGTPWPPVGGSRTTDAALLIIDHADYIISVDFLGGGERVTTISATIIEK